LILYDVIKSVNSGVVQFVLGTMPIFNWTCLIALANKGWSMKSYEPEDLAHTTIELLASNIPTASGAKRFGILEKLLQPQRLAKY
jgi:hypothetical protein